MTRLVATRLLTTPQRAPCALWLLFGVIALMLLLSACQARDQSSPNRSPMIDVHLHAHSLTQYGGIPNCANDQEILYPGGDPREPVTFARLKTCASPVPPASTDESLRSRRGRKR